MRLYDLETQFRRQVLVHALDAHRGNVSAAARSVGVERPYFYKLLKAHNIIPRRGKES